MWHEASRRGYPVYYFFSKKVWLNRRNTVSLNAVNLVKGLYKVKKRVVAAFAEVANIDTREYNFTPPVPSHFFGLFHKLWYGSRT